MKRLSIFFLLIAVALPGIRDFRGVKDRLDGNGNYTLGITDHSIFPEAHGDHSKYTLGMDICISTTASSDDEGRELLKLLGAGGRILNQLLRGVRMTAITRVLPRSAAIDLQNVKPGLIQTLGCGGVPPAV